MAAVMRAVTQPDAAIIERSWHEPERFAAVFDRYYPEIHGFASRRLGGSLADDVAAETFLIAFDRRRRYDLTRPDARPWLYGIASNLISRHRRAEALERAAVFAETRAALTPQPHQWIFTKERVSFLTPGPNKGHVNYGWGRVDGKGAAFLDENGKLRFRPVIKPPTGRHARKLPPEPWSYPTLTTLPTDPHALLRLASKFSGGPDPDAEKFDLFTAILRRGGLVPPKLEAAVFRAMALLRGVRLSNGPNVEGHPTLAVGRTNGSLYEEVLLDRKTFAYRGERSKLVKEDVGFERAKGIGPVGHAKGTVWLFERLVTAIVDRPGQLP